MLGSDFLADHGMIVDLRYGRLDWVGGSLKLQRPVHTEKQCHSVLEEDTRVNRTECTLATA